MTPIPARRALPPPSFARRVAEGAAPEAVDQERAGAGGAGRRRRADPRHRPVAHDRRRHHLQPVRLRRLPDQRRGRRRVRPAPPEEALPPDRRRHRAGDRSPGCSAIVLVAASITAGGLLTSWKLAVVLGGYVVLTFSYSTWLKHVPVLEMMLVAAGFLLRPIAGAAATDVQGRASGSSSSRRSVRCTWSPASAPPRPPNSVRTPPRTGGSSRRTRSRTCARPASFPPPSPCSPTACGRSSAVDLHNGPLVAAVDRAGDVRPAALSAAARARARRRARRGRARRPAAAGHRAGLDLRRSCWASTSNDPAAADGLGDDRRHPRRGLPSAPRPTSVAAALAAGRGAGGGVIARGLGPRLWRRGPERRRHRPRPDRPGPRAPASTRAIRQAGREATITVDAGISLDALMRMLVPLGYFVPVTPGTRYVTVGGAIGSDIHGKGHHLEGSFCQHVSELTLLLGVRRDRACVRPDDPATAGAFWATAGGMGLTGIVLTATVRLRRIESAYLRVDTERADNLDDCMERMSDAGRRVPLLGRLDRFADDRRRDGTRRAHPRRLRAPSTNCRPSMRKAPLAYGPSPKLAAPPWVPERAAAHRARCGRSTRSGFARPRASTPATRASRTSSTRSTGCWSGTGSTGARASSSTSSRCRWAPRRRCARRSDGSRRRAARRS